MKRKGLKKAAIALLGTVVLGTSLVAVSADETQPKRYEMDLSFDDDYLFEQYKDLLCPMGFEVWYNRGLHSNSLEAIQQAEKVIYDLCPEEYEISYSVSYNVVTNEQDWDISFETKDNLPAYDEGDFSEPSYNPVGPGSDIKNEGTGDSSFELNGNLPNNSYNSSDKNDILELPGNNEGGMIYKGDIDGDGKVTLADASKALKISLGIEEAGINEILSADMNNNSSVDLDDATIILKNALGITD